MAIKNCIGKTLLSVSRIQSYYNDKEDKESMGDLEFTFNDGLFLTLKGAGDAESIKAENTKGEIYESFQVTDHSVCSWRLLDLTSDVLWSRLIGQTLRSGEVEWYMDKGVEDRLTACILYFTSDFLIFYSDESDNNIFSVNVTLPFVDRETRREILK